MQLFQSDNDRRRARPRRCRGPHPRRARPKRQRLQSPGHGRSRRRARCRRRQQGAVARRSQRQEKRLRRRRRPARVSQHPGCRQRRGDLGGRTEIVRQARRSADADHRRHQRSVPGRRIWSSPWPAIIDWFSTSRTRSWVCRKSSWVCCPAGAVRSACRASSAWSAALRVILDRKRLNAAGGVSLGIGRRPRLDGGGATRAVRPVDRPRLAAGQAATRRLAAADLAATHPRIEPARPPHPLQGHRASDAPPRVGRHAGAVRGIGGDPHRHSATA